MTWEAWTTVIERVGFPIACVIAMSTAVGGALWWSVKNLARPLVSAHLETLRELSKAQRTQTLSMQTIARAHSELLKSIKTACKYSKRQCTTVKAARQSRPRTKKNRRVQRGSRGKL